MIDFKCCPPEPSGGLFILRHAPHLSSTANVDVTDFLRVVRQSAAWRFTPTLVYLITRAALAVQAHHAVVDGSDLGAYYQKIENLLADAEKIFANSAK